MKKSVLMLIAVFIIASVMMAAANAQEKKELTGTAAFVSSQCSACHKIEKVCGEINDKNAAQWAVTVKRMAAKGLAAKGTAIGEADQKKIVDFLSSPTERTALCPE